jgi:hypothetical protein
MPADHKQKDPTRAGVLALVTGPLGFLYLGWRYGLAAIVVFPSVMLVVAFLLPVPSWLMFVNLPVLAVIAYRICEKLNNLVDEGQHRRAVASKTLPVAVFAMTSSLPLLAAVNAAVTGITTTTSLLMGGVFGSGLITLLLVTPIFVVVNFVLGVAVAAGIDHAVLRVAPAAPRHVFPPAISVGE